MLRRIVAAFKAPSGTRAVSSADLKVTIGRNWYSSDPEFGTELLGNIDEDQWEGRDLDKTPITQIVITSAGLHTSSDPIAHFTGRVFDKDGNAVWFLDTRHNYYTNGVHFYPGGLPSGYDKKRFNWTRSDDENLIRWCVAQRRDIKTGRKI